MCLRWDFSEVLLVDVFLAIVCAQTRRFYSFLYENFTDRKIHGESNVQLKDRNRSTDFMFMLGLRETIDQLAMANTVRWYGHVPRREDGHVLRSALDFEVEGQRETKEDMDKLG